MAIAISSDVRAAILAASRASPDREICGLLLGDEASVTGHLPCRNVAVDPACAFEIDPVQLIAAHRTARAGGPGLIGCYHSHPSGNASPSTRDAAMAAADGWLWLIVAGDDIGLYQAVTNGPIARRFVALDYAVKPAAAPTLSG